MSITSTVIMIRKWFPAVYFVPKSLSWQESYSEHYWTGGSKHQIGRNNNTANAEAFMCPVVSVSRSPYISKTFLSSIRDVISHRMEPGFTHHQMFCVNWIPCRGASKSLVSKAYRSYIIHLDLKWKAYTLSPLKQIIKLAESFLNAESGRNCISDMIKLNNKGSWWNGVKFQAGDIIHEGEEWGSKVASVGGLHSNWANSPISVSAKHQRAWIPCHCMQLSLFRSNKHHNYVK